ncbi:MAG: IclR family transcriptional regulator [Nitriliruptoraceae bacterium]|nr:IclR family transcriptional regulator [Nitriliruptoraceae bacterium]
MTPPRPTVPAVTRAAAILELLAAQPDRALGPSELARALDLPKSSVANLCSALADTGLAHRTAAGYRLGRRLAALGAAYLAGVDVVSAFHEVLDAADPLPETVQLALLADGLEVVYLARRDGSAPVRLASDIGRRLPANCTATGKALLATLPPDELEARLNATDPLPQMTPRSITDPAALRDELARVRSRGYAVDDEEVVEGVVCLGAAIGGSSGAASAALSITLLRARASIDHLDALAAHLRQLAAELGARVADVDDTTSSSMW